MRRSIWMAALLVCAGCSRGDLVDLQDPRRLVPNRGLTVASARGAAPAVPAEVARWLARQHRPLRSLSAERWDDLRFLEPLLDGKRIVQLGESGHGMRETNLLKVRLVKFLHQELGFDVLAFESSFYLCYRADGMAATAPPWVTMTACTLGVWHTDEVEPLFRYIHDAAGSPRPLRLAGVDIQPIGWNRKSRPTFLSNALASVDADAAADALALDHRFLEAYARGTRGRREVFRQQGAEFAAGYDALVARLDAAGTPLDAALARDRLAARQSAWSAGQFVRREAEEPHGRAFIEIRERAMADNLDFILNELYPGKKVIVWGHNFHVRHDNVAIPPATGAYPGHAVRTMGSWVAERHRAALYTIGVYAGGGSSVDNGGHVFELDPPADHSLEAALLGTRKQLLFVDLSRQSDGPRAAWLRAPQSVRYDGRHPQSLVLPDQYDGLIFIRTVTPRIPFVPPQ